LFYGQESIYPRACFLFQVVLWSGEYISKSLFPFPSCHLSIYIFANYAAAHHYLHIFWFWSLILMNITSFFYHWRKILLIEHYNTDRGLGNKEVLVITRLVACILLRARLNFFLTRKKMFRLWNFLKKYKRNIYIWKLGYWLY